MRPHLVMLFPAFVMVIVGILYDFTLADFPAGGYSGCIDCTGIVNVGSFFNASIFAPLLQGDFLGFLFSLFTSTQTQVSLWSFVVGGVLIALSLGISANISILGSGVSLTMSDAGTRMAQSMGIAFIVWGFVSGFFGAWPTVITGWGLGTLITFVLPVIFFYGAYLQGKTIT